MLTTMLRPPLLRHAPSIRRRRLLPSTSPTSSSLSSLLRRISGRGDCGGGGDDDEEDGCENEHDVIIGGRRRRRRGTTMWAYDSLSSGYRSLPPPPPPSPPPPLPAPSSSSSSSSSLTHRRSSSSPPPPTPRPPRLGIATYVCGPTVYDSAHLGHGRTYVLLDVFRRVLMRTHDDDDDDDDDASSYSHPPPRPRPLHVMNVTDVDDKIIRRSREMGISDPLSLARMYEYEFWEDMDALNVLRPDVICRVSEHVESTIVPYVATLLRGGMARRRRRRRRGGGGKNKYDDFDRAEEGKDEDDAPPSGRDRKRRWGSVYFDVRAFEARAGGRTRYGKLAPVIISSTSSLSSTSPTSLASGGDFFSWDKRRGEDKHDNGDDDGEVVVEMDVKGEEVGDTTMMVRTRKEKIDPRDFCLWKYRPRTRNNNRRRRRSIADEEDFDPLLSTSSSNTKSHDDEDNINEIDVHIEPPSVSYRSPWGPGRPGWHVECSAMIERLSNDFRNTHEFGVHAGGIDLKFPHHTNEIAQTEAYRFASMAATEAAGDGVVDSNLVGGGKGSNSDGELREWIPHWVHTGHLYVKGRKMSKSLKNFITIREMLSSGSGCAADGPGDDAWHSPADDFRLWCLGLSGSYRGPSTFGMDRMEEARAIRMGWVRFLVEGQESLVRLQKSLRTVNDDDNHNVISNLNRNTSTKLWGDEELKLFRSVTRSDVACRGALLDDLDGSTFVREISHLAKTGLAYVEAVGGRYNDGDGQQRPEEPLRFTLDTFRGLLDLVGFTSRTVNAGMSLSSLTHNSPLFGQLRLGSEPPSSGMTAASGSTTLLDEIVAFRAFVRSAALSDIRKRKEKDGSSGPDAANKILLLCDELRDDVFPKFGVEILDGKVIDKEGAAATEGTMEGRCDEREARGKRNTIVLGGIEFG
ncbi:hypothetical protein ACHAXA_009234 [Cyclostephanos tholiformis]|uniref:tRNA synthetases class I catalytic domain-containing protein n=1 Tax=Cyclostephanos tholiformis TaxID=382380 RepID=A0ABD3RAA0_9STRA